MKLVKETKTKFIYEYFTPDERNEHIKSYGLLHDIKQIYGDGNEVPLTVEFNKAFRKLHD